MPRPRMRRMAMVRLLHDMNPAGHPATLSASHPGNVSRLVHGAYAERRHMTEHGEQVAAWLRELPHVTAADQLAAEEVGALVSVLERIDAALADGRVENRRGEARALLDLRRRYSAELGKWLDRFGATTPRPSRLGETTRGRRSRRRDRTATRHHRAP